MTTVEGKLAVMGGAAKINGMNWSSLGLQAHSRFLDPFLVVKIIQHKYPGGDTEYLDDVEIFDGRRWKRANYKLDQVRSMCFH